jgi:hypothetical protein
MSRAQQRLNLTPLMSVIMLLVIYWAAGCGSNDNNNTAALTQAATASLNSAPTATATAKPSATPTKAATGTPSQTATGTATPTPSPTATPTATPTTNADVIIFSPAATMLTATGGALSIQMNSFDINGNPITPSASNPINVAVYGAPSGVITPASATITSGSTFAFRYSGAAVPNNISVNAWIADQTTGGAAIGQTQLLPQNAACMFGSVEYSVPLISTVPNVLQIMGAVGYLDASSASGHLKTYTIDTGSLGTIVNASDLPTSDGVNGLAIGPAGQGVKCYDSSNNAYFGNYYIAPVDIQVVSGSTTTTVQTNPLIVLAANQFCSVTNCTSSPLVTSNCTTRFSIHYMGVGFDRPITAPGDLFNGPTANALLHVTDANNGTDIGPGYILSANGVTLGINSTSGYNTINLTANTSVPGDWNAQPACYSFPQLPVSNRFCGTGLLDVGISEMFNDLPFAQRPAGTFDSNNKVPANLTMNVLMGSSASPAASYTYTTVLPPTPPSGPAPTESEWIDTTKTGSIFVNTGRDPLNCYNYLFAGQCGQVAFQKVTPSPTGCSAAN